MNLERLLIVSIAVAGTGGLLALSNLVGANATRQGNGDLAQEPMHLGATVQPNFIMAIDDSGSMTFQTLFPGQDGEGCWSSGSFFNGTSLRTSGACEYFYVLPGPRVNNYNGIPPVDAYGFARSPNYNPSYYDPAQTYEPWMGADLKSYGDASLTATKIHPAKTATVNLFTESFHGDMFLMQRDMVLPQGTKYKTCDDWNGAVCDDWSAEQTAPAGGFKWTNSTARNVLIAYKPAIFYLKTNATLAGYTAPVEVTNACGTGCSLYRYSPNDTGTQQNFANWFSYYGNRNRAMIAGLTRSLVGVDKLRVGYFTINSRVSGAYANVGMRDMDSDTDKKALMANVLQLGANGGTPNRHAVAHIGSQFANNTSIIEHACQKNAGMLFTDGYSNDNGPTSPFGNDDSGMGVPFTDGHSDTMADIAAYYYNATLRGPGTTSPLTPGKVPTSNPTVCEGVDAQAKKAADCNTNLHMNFYGVTLGAKGKLFGVSYGVTATGNSGALATQQALAGATSPAWEARTDNSPNTVDEIWHATMNARGAYVNAQTPAAITNAMRDVLASVGVGGGVSGSLAVTGTRLGDSSLSVTPRFARNGVDWYGDVIASKPSRGTGADAQLSYTTVWTASNKLPAASARTLLYATTSDDSTPAVADFYNAGPSDLDLLCENYTAGCGPISDTDIATLDVTIDQAVKYLAGDRSLEGTKLRKRTQPIGDIVNSTPVVAAPTDDYGYALLRKADGSFGYDPYEYNDYLDEKKDRKRSVYVGANDGMLHGFDGESGVEQFGYIPATAVGYMGNLLFPSSPNFQHRYYVDGPITISDALFGSADWRTVLVGTAGAGSRSVFGLDISSVGASTFLPKNVLWEVNDKIAGPVGDRIGFVLGKPLIVPVRGSDGAPEWKAVFGGGYGNRLNNSVDGVGTVTLFVVDMKTGAVDYIDAKETAGPGRGNGLGNVVAIDRLQYNKATSSYVTGSDGMVDIVYGGDLDGNVWKFDLTKSGTARVGGSPLFTATDAGGVRQPITGGLEAALGPRGGVMVMFGTGSFSFDGDKQNTDIHTMYGVLDMPGETTLPLTRSRLVAQTIGAADAAGQSIITNHTVNYFSMRGWYLDLAVTGGDGKLVKKGERMVGYPRLEGGTLYFPTYAPDAGDACSGGGVNYLYGLAALSGGGNLGMMRWGKPTGDALGEGTGKLSLTSDGSAPIKDVSVFTTGKQGSLGGEPDNDAIADYDELPPEYCLAIVSVAGSEPLYRVRPCGRQSWRQTR